MTPEQAFDKWASERGVSQAVDAANWEAYQEAIRAHEVVSQSTNHHAEVVREFPHEYVAPVVSEDHSETQPHE